MYYFINSQEAVNIYNLNTWNDFSVDLPMSLYLHKDVGWKKALLQLDIDTLDTVSIASKDAEHSSQISIPRSRYIYLQ